MRKLLLFLFFALFVSINSSHSQIRSTEGASGKRPIGISDLDSTLINNKRTIVKLSGKTKFTDYKVISFKNDTTYIDTTLTILKEYKYNFLRKDNFELLAFHNQGQTFNTLAYDFSNQSRLPIIGMNAKHFNYVTASDINYFEVPTPTTEILYRTGLQQGQVLETLFTLNFSKRFNVGINYKGLRSLGNFRNSLASHGNFSTFFSYRNKSERYRIRGHITTQDLMNEENGGLTQTSLDAFINEDPNFTDRGRMDVNLEGTETKLEGERFFFEHDYKLFSRKDSLNQNFTNLKIGHSFSHETKSYEFTQSSTSAYFGNTSSSSIEEKVESKYFNNQLFLEFNSKYILGRFRVKTDFTNYNYGYASILNTNSTTITTPKIKGTAISFGGSWNAKIKNFQLNSEVNLTPGSGKISGNTIYSEAIFKKDSLFTLKGSISINSKSPNFNTVLYQSGYDDYNWQNDNFKNINTRNISFGVATKWIHAKASITNIENYTYFDAASKPQQSGENITYLKVKASNEFKFGKFALNNTVLFQQVSSGQDVFRVPNLVTRNTLYYSNFLFEGNPLFLQTGITFKYFSKFKSNAFNPLLNEFRIQNTTEIGYPTLDVFINAQIRRTRIYIKADNLSSMFLKKNYFSAPNHPYRDFVIRFGLVWNWFI
ncbi:MAG: putative porin [Flavobacteriaceae bacterium]|nr:putative porin [Flavobacteriaceae bacterium]